jgi:type IX secretion system PorP/SprF family membrane protein
MIQLYIKTSCKILMKYALLFLFMVGWQGEIFGQQLPTFTQYREYHGLLNPASVYIDYIRETHATFVGMSTRMQWTGVPNAPRTHLLHAERLIRRKASYPKKSYVQPNLGLYVISDKAGRLSTNAIYGKMSVVFSSDPEYVGISVGINAGLVQYNIKVNENEDIGYSGFDNSGKIHPDVGIGVYGYRKISDGDAVIFGGFSIPQFFTNNVKFSDNLQYSKVKHMYGTIGYNQRTSSGGFVESSLWLKKVEGLGMVLDGNTRYQFGSVFWIGGGYSTAGVLNAESGVLLNFFEKGNRMQANNRLKIGLGFETAISGLNVFGNSYELNLSYSFGRTSTKNPTRRYNRK